MLGFIVVSFNQQDVVRSRGRHLTVVIFTPSDHANEPTLGTRDRWKVKDSKNLRREHEREFSHATELIRGFSCRTR